MFCRASRFAAALRPWVGKPRSEVGDTMAEICLSLGDEHCPSHINTCALMIILGSTAEFTIIPISQLDKLRPGEGVVVSCPRLP